MSTNLTFDDHKKNIQIAINGMNSALEPLNEKLKPLDMMIYISDMNTFLNPFEATSRTGFGIYINVDKIEKMLAMTDEQLIEKLRN